MLDNYITKTKTLVVLKGINADDFVNKYEIKPLFEKEGNQSFFNLDEVSKNWYSESINKISELKEPAFISYRDFMLLSQLGEVTLSTYIDEIIILKNNLFYEYYPCLFKEKDLSKVEEFLSYSENYTENATLTQNIKLLDIYFNDIKKIENRYYVCFKDVQFDLIKYNLDMYDIQLDDKIKVTPTDGKSDRTFDIGTSAQSLLGIIDYAITNSNKTINIASACGYDKVNILIQKLKIHNNSNKYNMTDAHIEKEETNKDFVEILKRVWGYDDFKNITIYSNPDIDKETIEISQAQIIQDISNQSIAAYNQNNFGDIFITAPTGAGKSVIFQTSAIYVAEKTQSLTIIISPLIALMKDQVENLSKLGYKKSAYLNSELSYTEKENTIKEVKEGNIDILYLSPETLINSYNIENIIGNRKIGLFIVDEAHIVTTWGREFRPDYWYLGGYISKIRKNKNKFPICTFTATAVYGGSDDMYDEIIDSLGMNVVSKYLGKIRRDDISFKINCNHNNLAFEEYNEFKKNELINFIINTYFEGKKAIIYFPFAKTIDELYNDTELDICRDKIAKYHAKLQDYIKDENLHDFKVGEKKIMFATKAFGMGIDIDDIDYVYHFAPTGNLNDYVQEIGRSARGSSIIGTAFTDFNYKDFKYINMLRSMTSITNNQLKLVLKKLYEIYSIQNKRNFLVTPTDFSHIFSGEGEKGVNELERKIKSILLILENDLKNEYSFPALISKPQSMFTKSFVVIRDTEEDKVLNSEFGQYFSKICEGRKKEQYGCGTKISDCGNIYSLDLKSLWEDKYPKYTFGAFKYHLLKDRDNPLNFQFQNDIFLRYKISIYSNLEINKLKDALIEEINYTNTILDNYFTEKIMFSKKDFSEKLYVKYKDKDLCNKIANSYLDLIQPISNNLSFNKKFIEFNNETKKYRLLNTTYKSVIKNHITNSSITSRLQMCDSKEVVFYQGSSAKNPYDSFRVLFLLELFGLAKYKISGGDNPEIFIRLNDPKKIARLSSSDYKYKNKLLSQMKKKHETSKEILTKFFTSNMNNSQRWDFIEDYFLGQNVLSETDTFKE